VSTRRRVTARVDVSTDRGVFMISVAAELAEMHPQTLRMYEQRGLIEPKRSPKGTRLYSLHDVERLRRIQEMTAELGLNLAGVERVLELEERLEASQKRVERLQHELDVTKTKLDEAERRLKGEIVPYRRGEVIPVRQRDAR
jgi:MerR family transcriptional regulator/heat shock protein HspR